jgi:hypothetical protein
MAGILERRKSGATERREAPFGRRLVSDHAKNGISSDALRE